MFQEMQIYFFPVEYFIVCLLKASHLQWVFLVTFSGGLRMRCETRKFIAMSCQFIIFTYPKKWNTFHTVDER